MEHIAAFLLLVGCSDNLDQCREVPAPAPIFETAQECDAVMERAMRDLVGKYPQILARCVNVDPSAEYGDASLVWDVSPAGDLTASLEAGPSDRIAPSAGEMVASNTATPTQTQAR